MLDLALCKLLLLTILFVQAVVKQTSYHIVVSMLGIGQSGHLSLLDRFEFSIYCTGDDGEIWGHCGFQYRVCLHDGVVPHAPEEHRSECLRHGRAPGRYLCTPLPPSGLASLDTSSPLSVSVLSPGALSPFLLFLFFSCQTC